MTDKKFDVIIIGGSYAGLSAAMALGRALRNVLIIDSGKPCNSQTPHSHNFLTQDGKTPKEISSVARKQVERYENVIFHSGLATAAVKLNEGFEVTTENNEVFSSKKLIVATGVKDVLPAVPGMDECWGISLIHCPYCHGYEVRNEITGILSNGDIGFEYAKMISNWTDKLTIFTNGTSTLTEEQIAKLASHKIQVNETVIKMIAQHRGNIEKLILKDGQEFPLKALYHKPAFLQHDIVSSLSLEINEHGYIKVDPFQKTNIPGVYACGDNTNMMRSISAAVATGTVAGAVLNKEIVDEEF